MRSLLKNAWPVPGIIILSGIMIIFLLGCAGSDIKKDLNRTENILSEKATAAEKEKGNIPLNEEKPVTIPGTLPIKIETPVPANEEYLLGPDDVLFVSVWKYPDLGTNLEVSNRGGTPIEANGNLFFPIVGNIKVGGLSIPMARKKITEAYSKYVKDPQVTVTIQKYGSKRYYVIGEVGKPGVYQMEKNTKLLEAMTIAGGITYRANISKAYIIRENAVLPIDFEEVLTGKNLTQNVELVNGDFIYIPTLTEDKVYVLGEVKNPGVAPMAKGRLTLLSAIADRGDFSIFAIKDDIKVIRGGLRNPQIITVDLSNLKGSGAVQNIELAAEDIVYVPQTRLGTWNKILEQITPSLRAIVDSMSPIILYRALLNTGGRGGGF